jgi:uncharacterized protein (TIRG00374 family)
MKKLNPLRNLIILVLLGFVAYSFIGKVAGFKNILLDFHSIAPVFLVLALIAASLTYIANAYKFKFLLESQGYNFKFRDLLKLGMVGSFAIHFLPVGNFGESALNFYLLRQKGVKTGSALSLFLTRLISDYLAFFSLFTISLAFLPVHPSLNLKIKIGFFIMLFALIAVILYLNYILKRPKVFNKHVIPLLKYLKKSVHFIQHFEKNKEPQYYYEDMSNELREEMIKNMNFNLGIKLISGSAIYWLADIATLYFCLLGLGLTLNPFAVVFAYIIAVIAGVISFLPAGIGAVEATLIFVLNSFTVNLPAIGLAVLSYRFISLWLAMPLGFIAFYRLSEAKNLFKKEKVVK